MSEEEKEFKEIQKRISKYIDQAIESLEDVKDECFKSMFLEFKNIALDEREGILAKIDELRDIKRKVICQLPPTYNV